VGTCDVGTCPALATCPAIAQCVSEPAVAVLPRTWGLALLVALLLGTAMLGLRVIRPA
jgi:hypothetical protein